MPTLLYTLITPDRDILYYYLCSLLAPYPNQNWIHGYFDPRCHRDYRSPTGTTAHYNLVVQFASYATNQTLSFLWLVQQTGMDFQ